jgi:hypothetical protein
MNGNENLKKAMALLADIEQAANNHGVKIRYNIKVSNDREVLDGFTPFLECQFFTDRKSKD